MLFLGVKNIPYNDKEKDNDEDHIPVLSNCFAGLFEVRTIQAQ